ncbi:hypothetical protein V491_08876 [Pseudogymnoascus sp. VKM F-3775]|nr:hypothetical protein V491_08876 [Pseudogymnoascus sp. VKM F-3775]
MSGAGMQLGLASAGLPGEAADAFESSNGAKSDLAGLRALDSHGRSHNRAAAGNGLEVGHGAATWGGMVAASWAAGGREGAESRWRGLLQEGTHGLGLPKNGVHGGGW